MKAREEQNVPTKTEIEKKRLTDLYGKQNETLKQNLKLKSKNSDFFKIIFNLRGPNKIDEISKRLFPVSFLVFNLYFWTSVASNEKTVTEHNYPGTFIKIN